MTKTLFFWQALPTDLRPGRVVNTARVGDKWSDLTPGEIIDLGDADTKQRLGSAIVTGVDEGAWRQVEHLAGLNHSVYGQPNAGSQLYDQLKKVYDGKDGRPLFDQHGSLVVFVSFLPITDDQLAGYAAHYLTVSSPVGGMLDEASFMQRPEPEAKAPEPVPPAAAVAEGAETNPAGSTTAGDVTSLTVAETVAITSVALTPEQPPAEPPPETPQEPEPGPVAAESETAAEAEQAS